MKDLMDSMITSVCGSVDKVDFYTITGAMIPLCETVADVNDYPILCQINGSHIYALNFSYETKIEEADTNINDE